MNRNPLYPLFIGLTVLAAFYGCAFSPLGPNQAPTISILSPSPGASFSQTADILVTAEASDTDGEIARVEFYSAETLLGTVSASPFQYTWSNTLPGDYSLTAVAYDDQEASATSAPVTVTVLSATTAWVQATPSAVLPATSLQSAVSYHGLLYILGGKTSASADVYGDDVWYSSDGVTWFTRTVAAAFGNRGGHSSVVFGDSMWVIGGNGGGGALASVYRSRNEGISWDLVTNTAAFGPRAFHASVVFANYIWVIGGLDAAGYPLNDVWQSSNGSEWTRASASAPFPARSEFAAVTLNGRVWVIGGRTAASALLDDVWSSSNGITWTQVSSGNYTPRSGHAAVAFGGALWMTGGMGAAGALSDTLRSTDGVTWALQSGSAFGARSGHSFLEFNAGLWIVGGLTAAGALSNDVWYRE